MEIQLIPSGEFAIGKKGNVSLMACLGTCVGVTLADKKAGIGGLLHLLLPEPTGNSTPFRLDIYASSGVPRFIEAMLDQGASKEHMEACIAGGAFVGPLSKQDISLNIGGRTTQIVLSILESHGIPVKHIEAGGYFSCKLTIALNSFESFIEPICDPYAIPEKLMVKPTLAEIDDTISKISPIPQIALRIIQMLHDGDYNMTELGNEIRQDQIICAKTIQLCNSVLFGLKIKVDSIEHAITLLGENRLLLYIISASISNFFPESSFGYSLCKGGLYEHALGTAQLARAIAGYTRRSTPEKAYTAGLLHDIGKIPLDQYISYALPFFYRSTQLNGMGFTEMEKEKFGITHSEAGEELAEKWELPDNLKDVIKNHHRPENSTVDRDLVTLVYLSDLLMSRFNVRHELEMINTDQFTERLKTIGLTTAQLPEIIDLMPKSVFYSSQD